MRRLIGTAVVLGTFLLSLASASGDAQSGTRGKDLVLEGLGGVSVCIDQINAELVQAGLSPSQLRAEAEQKLRAAGVRVLTQEERMKVAGMPFLHLQVEHVMTAAGQYCVHASLSLEEQSQPTRRIVHNPEMPYLLREMEEQKGREPGFREAVDFLATMHANGPFARTWVADTEMDVLEPANLQGGVSEMVGRMLDEYARAYHAAN